MQSVGETLDLLLVVHFSNSVVSDVRRPLPLTAVPNVWMGGWMPGLSLIRQWKGQFIFFPHTKVQEWMGYSWPCRNIPSIPLPGQDLACLPGNWLGSSHMPPGKSVFM